MEKRSAMQAAMTSLCSDPMSIIPPCRRSSFSKGPDRPGATRGSAARSRVRRDRVELEFPRFDLSLENRRATQNQVVYEAAAAIREHGSGLKAATITPESAGDVGSPNRMLREEIGGKVIVGPAAGFPASSRSAASTRRSRSCAWRSATRTARRSGARARATTRSRSARSASSGESAAQSPSSPSARRAHGREGLRRPEVHREPDLRGDAQGGDGRCRRAAPRRPVRAATHRRDVRAADLVQGRADGDPGPEPRPRHPLRPRVPPVRLDRRGRVVLVAFGDDFEPNALWPRRRTAPPRRWRARTSPTRWR